MAALFVWSAVVISTHFECCLILQIELQKAIRKVLVCTSSVKVSEEKRLFIASPIPSLALSRQDGFAAKIAVVCEEKKSRVAKKGFLINT